MSMLDPRAYEAETEVVWCPGCGDFAILRALKLALAELSVREHEVLVVTGIGCGSKLPDYLEVNGNMTLHGRPLPVASGAKLANPELNVVVVDGDGDCYGIGGNHFVQTCRRNPDITHVVENNQVYGLTKGQYSPTSDKGFVTTTSPDGSIEAAFNPVAVALAAGATFIARSFAGEPKHTARMITEGMRHRGYALIDVLQPCVTFNRVNTYDWYRERVYHLPDNHDAANRDAAWEKAHEWAERIPLGILYQTEGLPSYEEQVSALTGGSPASHLQSMSNGHRPDYEGLKKRFV